MFGGTAIRELLLAERRTDRRPGRDPIRDEALRLHGGEALVDSPRAQSRRSARRRRRRPRPWAGTSSAPARRRTAPSRRSASRTPKRPGSCGGRHRGRSARFCSGGPPRAGRDDHWLSCERSCYGRPATGRIDGEPQARLSPRVACSSSRCTTALIRTEGEPQPAEGRRRRGGGIAPLLEAFSTQRATTHGHPPAARFRADARRSGHARSAFSAHAGDRLTLDQPRERGLCGQPACRHGQAVGAAAIPVEPVHDGQRRVLSAFR